MFVLSLHHFRNIVCLCKLFDSFILIDIKFRLNKGIFLFLELEKLATLKGVVDLRRSICAQRLLIEIIQINKLNGISWYFFHFTQIHTFLHLFRFHFMVFYFFLLLCGLFLALYLFTRRFFILIFILKKNIFISACIFAIHIDVFF